MCKKLLSLLLALCVAVSLAVVPASADTPDAGEASTPTQSAGLSEMEGLGDGSAALQIELGNGKKYVIGFTLGEGETRTIMRQSYEGYYWRDISGKPNPDNPSDKRLDAAVAVAEIVSDGSGEHYEFDSLPLSVNVLSMDLRYVSGDGSADDNPYSFSGDSDVTHLDAVEGNSAGIYLKQGYATDAQVVAKVEVSNNGEVLETGNVALKLSGYHIYEDTVVCEAGASANEITDAIEAAVDEAPSREDSQTSGGTIHVVLEGNRYEGTIQIPANVMQTKGDYEIRFEPAGATGRATIVGGVVCNNSQVSFYNMDFVAPEGQKESRAIYDGRSWAVNCTFREYAVAMDAGEGDINGMGATYSVFYENETALISRGDLANGLTGCAFINNGTAVLIPGLRTDVVPFYCRIAENNFVSNGVDFDVRCPGTFYFYRNYYGRVKSNASMTSAEILGALRDGCSSDILRQPPTVNVADHSETKVVTNPRWKDPVELEAGVPPLLSGSSGSLPIFAPMVLTALVEQPENYLTADWERVTEIVAGETNLKISAAAFATASKEKRIISVVSYDANTGKTTTLAEWNFGTAAHNELAESSAVFDASLTVTRSETDGSVTVTLNAASELLEVLKPKLTVPDASGGVEHNGAGVASSRRENGSVSFTVSGGGSYEISEANEEIAETPEMPGKPSMPGTPVTPPESGEDEPEQPSFTDVARGAWYTDAVNYVVANGLMEGTSTTTFEPDATMTRSMVWAILARIDGEAVTGGSWVDIARDWAMANGISDGTDPNRSVTREQLATMLWRYAGEPATAANLAGYSDGASVSAYAVDAMSWCVEHMIITGVTDTTLVPQGTATRAQCATMLMRFVER